MVNDMETGLVGFVEPRETYMPAKRLATQYVYGPIYGVQAYSR